MGIVNYYSDMWYRRSYLLQPLTIPTPEKVTFKCTDAEKKSFEYIK